MSQPSRRHSIRANIHRSGWRPLVIGSALLGLSACAQMFTITPEDGGAALAKKPAPKVDKSAKEPAKEPEKKPEKKAPEPKAEKPKVEKAAEKPKVEKPAEQPVTKPVAVAPPPKAEAKVEAEAKKAEPPPKPVRQPDPPKVEKAKTPAVVVPSPPAVRRAEPVYEAPALEPAPGASDSAGIARLTYAAALWDAVRLFHPGAAANRAEWDNITVRKLTDVRAAKTRAEYATVMREWLGRLNDPVTRLVDNTPGGTTSVIGNGPADIASQTQVVVTGAKKTRTEDTTVVLKWPSARMSFDSAAWSNLRAEVRNLHGTSPLVIDLRVDNISPVRSVDNENVRRLQLDVANDLATVPALGAGVRRRVYEGWPDERVGVASAIGVAAWRVSDAAVAVVPADRSAAKARRIVFVANGATEIAPALMALVSSRQAVLVAEGALSDRSYVPVTRIALGDGLVAEVRTGELINADGKIGIQADTTLAPASAPSDSAPAVRVAIQIARGKISTPVSNSSASATNAFANVTTIASNAWTNAHYPIMGARLLAAFKMWGTLRAFHSYGDLRDENVDDALQRFIPRAEAAADAYSYTSTMLEYATTLNDAQAVMTSPTLVQHLGAASAPFAVRWIEDRAIVTQVAADEAGRATGLSVGDEISAADGFPMAAYINEHRRYGAASNEWTQYRNTTALIPRGVPGEGLYRVRDANNRERTVNIPRSANYLNRFPESERIGQSAIRELTGGVGYLDLDRASEAQIDSGFKTLGSSRALILDARGRGRVNSSGTMSGALQDVLRKLATFSDVAIDRQTIRVASEPCAANSRSGATSCVVERRQFEDLVSSDTLRRYKGRVVVLIDERTQGAMEQFGLGVESVANPVFIGSPSAGAAGTITSMNLPGQINLTFSGSELRHADGRQLQRVGLTPQVEVAPTIKGVRAGTDEVLERAQQWLAQQLDPAPPKRKR